SDPTWKRDPLARRYAASHRACVRWQYGSDIEYDQDRRLSGLELIPREEFADGVRDRSQQLSRLLTIDKTGSRRVRAHGCASMKFFNWATFPSLSSAQSNERAA